eukprot:9394209-Prorocentrum_lima.AAC.1
MTSSLVGSEMCIRDSLENYGVYTIQSRSWYLAHFQGKEVESDMTESVSYTHLTLPTICSV